MLFAKFCKSGRNSPARVSRSDIRCQGRGVGGVPTPPPSASVLGRLNASSSARMPGYSLKPRQKENAFGNRVGGSLGPARRKAVCTEAAPALPPPKLAMTMPLDFSADMFNSTVAKAVPAAIAAPVAASVAPAAAPIAVWTSKGASP